MGRLECIIGPMFSGKSTELIRRLHKEQSIKKRIIAINYIDDNRYSSKPVVATHSGLTVESLKVKRLNDIDVNLFNQYDSVFIDEAQFFSDLYDAVRMLVDTFDKHVVVAGLDGDMNRKPFGEIIQLIPICDSVDKLTAYCNKCNDGTCAPFTIRKDNSTRIGELIDIGHSDKYIPVCRLHYFSC
jgi:thymidine kinase